MYNIPIYNILYFRVSQTDLDFLLTLSDNECELTLAGLHVSVYKVLNYFYLR